MDRPNYSRLPLEPNLRKSIITNGEPKFELNFRDRAKHNHPSVARGLYSYWLNNPLGPGEMTSAAPRVSWKKFEGMRLLEAALQPPGTQGRLTQCDMVNRYLRFFVLFDHIVTHVHQRISPYRDVHLPAEAIVEHLREFEYACACMRFIVEDDLKNMFSVFGAFVHNFDYMFKDDMIVLLVNKLILLEPTKNVRRVTHEFIAGMHKNIKDTSTSIDDQYTLELNRSVRLKRDLECEQFRVQHLQAKLDSIVD